MQADDPVFAAYLDALPASARHMVDVMGVPDALAVIRAYGGLVIYVPKSACRERSLPPGADAVSDEQLAKLCQYYGGGMLSVPKCETAMRLLRDALILAHKRAGKTLNELAAEHRMTNRGICKVLRRIERHEREPWCKAIKQGQQIDIFG